LPTAASHFIRSLLDSHFNPSETLPDIVFAELLIFVALQLEPHNKLALHAFKMIQLLSDDSMPSKNAEGSDYFMEAEYIQQLFDSYAFHFISIIPYSMILTTHRIFK